MLSDVIELEFQRRISFSELDLDRLALAADQPVESGQGGEG